MNNSGVCLTNKHASMKHEDKGQKGAISANSKLSFQ
jgi:hypothetical protein